MTFVDNKEGLIGLRVGRALEQPATTPEVFTDAAGHTTTVPMLNNEGVTGRYRSSEGLEGDSVWGTRGRWAMLSGVVDGQPVTLAILDHPQNVGFPTYWHARDYGLFAANPLGAKVFSKGATELNFRLAPGAVHDVPSSRPDHLGRRHARAHRSLLPRLRAVTAGPRALANNEKHGYREIATWKEGAMSHQAHETLFGTTMICNRWWLLAFAACAAALDAQTRPTTARPNQLTDAERAAGWRLLFDGQTLAGWRGVGYDTVPTAHWVVADGAIKKIANGNVPRVADGRPLNGGDLMSIDTFGDFELSWEWKVTPGANSGVKYNVSEELSITEGGAGTSTPNHSALGFEYQMLDDDRHEDGTVPKHRAGALYDLIVPNEHKHLRPVGEWNESRVVLRGNHGEHWLNGEKIVEFDLGTRRIDSLLAVSKYRSIPGFATRRKGHIVLQDHGDEVYFRNIKLREL